MQFYVILNIYAKKKYLIIHRICIFSHIILKVTKVIDLMTLKLIIIVITLSHCSYRFVFNFILPIISFIFSQILQIIIVYVIFTLITICISFTGCCKIGIGTLYWKILSYFQVQKILSSNRINHLWCNCYIH